MYVFNAIQPLYWSGSTRQPFTDWEQIAYNVQVHCIVDLYIACYIGGGPWLYRASQKHCTVLLTTREAAWYRICGIEFWWRLYVCLSVCLSDDNFRKSWHRKFIFAHAAYLHGLRVEFVNEGHRVKAKKVENSYSHNVKILSAITRYIRHRAVMFACSMGFSVWRVEWCNRHLCHVTGSEHA